MSAEEGVAWGFYNRLVAQSGILAEAVAFAAALANGPTVAHAMTKRMLHEEWNLSIEQAVDAEARAQARCMQTEDFRRAYRAFAAKEKPVFEGN
jgi:enoyl-CoA hydratase/carnithine racemase